MKQKRKKIIGISGCFVIVIVIVFFIFKISKPQIKEISLTERLPVISPDYTNITLPPNIAPLNFIIQEEGNMYLLKMYGTGSDTITLYNKSPKMIIPQGKWKKLLKDNRGKDIYFDIYTANEKGAWLKYKSVVNHIALEEVDNYLVYRLINPGYILYDKMGIYCRNVQNFEETPVMVNKLAERNCMNCHSFCKNDANKMIFHIRGSLGGTVLFYNGMLKKINTATGYTMSAGVYPAWHPGGKFIAFSVNQIRQKFNTSNEEPIEVFDGYSDIILYDIEANMVTTSPKVSTKRRENMPEWSPDGKYLYFCSAPEIADTQKHGSIYYDLMRISYDTKTGKWSNVEAVLTSEKTKKSIAWPKISPDGKYILFCMARHGYFTIHYRSGDLYLMDIARGQYKKLDINSESVESYHSWSHNSRWFVFSCKKDDGLCSRPYYSYIDEKGNASKPFVLPQKDPEFYQSFLKNYNVPEMVSNKVDLNKNELFKVVNREPTSVSFDPAVDIDALSGASKIKSQK
jgi:hypothetical protein